MLTALFLPPRVSQGLFDNLGGVTDPYDPRKPIDYMEWREAIKQRRREDEQREEAERAAKERAAENERSLSKSS